LSTPRRSYAWEYVTLSVASAGGVTLVLGAATPSDQIVEVEAADVIHNGAVATDLGIGLLRGGEFVLYVSSSTDAARPLGGVPVVLPRRVSVPPMWQLVGAANNLALGELLTIRALIRREVL
jgi:hypothetical protein